MNAERDETERIEGELTHHYLAQCDAMIHADVAALGALLAPEFTLTHMTGYAQSKADWLDDIGSGRMAYHSIRNVDVHSAVAGDGVSLTARSHTRATIWGGLGTWRLQLRVHFEATPEGWLATRTVASTW